MRYQNLQRIATIQNAFANYVQEHITTYRPQAPSPSSVIFVPSLLKLEQKLLHGHLHCHWLNMSQHLG